MPNWESSWDYWSRRGVMDLPGSLQPHRAFLERLKPASIVLDIGCGRGGLCRELARAGHRAWGVDFNATALLEAPAGVLGGIPGAGPSFACASASRMPFHRGSFDAAVLQAVLTVIPSPKDRMEVLREARRVLRPGGVLYIADFAQTWSHPLYRRRYVESLPITGEEGLFIVRDEAGRELFRAKHFTRAEIEKPVLEAGFSIASFIAAEMRTRTGNTIGGFHILAI